MSLQWVTIKDVRCISYFAFVFTNLVIQNPSMTPHCSERKSQILDIWRVLFSLVPLSLHLQVYIVVYIVLFFSLVSSWFLPWPVLQLLKCTSFHLRVFKYTSRISFPLPVTPSSSLFSPSSTFLFGLNTAKNFSQRWWFW